MTNKSKWEQMSVETAVEAAGEIVEAMINEGYGTDLNEWPDEAFPGMVETLIEAYVEKMQELAASTAPPF